MAAGHVLVDDYASARVPREARYSWWSVAVQRFGQVSALSQFLLGSTLGFGMPFWTAFWAFTLGAVVLELVSIGTGIIGCREGMQTSLLTRWDCDPVRCDPVRCDPARRDPVRRDPVRT